MSGTTTRTVQALLYDSEATLRLVDQALSELHPPASADGEERSDSDLPSPAASPAPAHGPSGLSQLPRTLLRAYAEITGILERLRESRGVLEQAAVERLQHMNEKLHEVSSATEVAATDILNGVDRTIAMIDELEALACGTGDGARAAVVRQNMRDELFGLMVHLQFQDITTQQLAYASNVIVDMEQRLAHMVSVFDPHALGIDVTTPTPAGSTAIPVAFDPNATHANAADRQALADELFTTRR